MELFVQGKEYHTGYKLPLVCYFSQRDLSENINLRERFKFIFLKKGTALININEKSLVITSPSILCISERDKIDIKDVENLKYDGIYFHPSVINRDLNFENVRGDGQGLSVTASQDIYWLRPFVERDGKFCGHISMGPAVAQRIKSLMVKTKEELETQSDGDWPCRSRSYFLELLLLVEKLYTFPERQQDITLSGFSDDVDSIILYLHNNYHKKITIKLLSDLFHINRTTLTEKFSEATGLTVRSYLIKLRIRLACVMLRDTNLQVMEIMERVGFNNFTHFGRTFRHKTGYSPTEYRDKYSWFRVM